jgi:hypothetical protein
MATEAEVGKELAEIVPLLLELEKKPRLQDRRGKGTD